jgi:hypothetical protein
MGIERSAVTRRSTVSMTAFTVAVAGLVTAGIARAATTDQPVVSPPNATAQTSLVLTITPQSAGTPKTVSLECDPTGGSHPRATDACVALQTASGQIDQIQPQQGAMCPHTVAPIRATATGTYAATPMAYEHTWNNSCEMTRATGPLFDF